VDDFRATKSENVGLIVRAISFQDFQPCGHDPPTSQTDRQTDGQTTCDRKTALCTIVHRAVKTWSFALRQRASDGSRIALSRLC